MQSRERIAKGIGTEGRKKAGREAGRKEGCEG